MSAGRRVKIATKLEVRLYFYYAYSPRTLMNRTPPPYNRKPAHVRLVHFHSSPAVDGYFWPNRKSEQRTHLGPLPAVMHAHDPRKWWWKLASTTLGTILFHLLSN
jgi:hypothetical protein